MIATVGHQNLKFRFPNLFHVVQVPSKFAPLLIDIPQPRVYINYPPGGQGARLSQSAASHRSSVSTDLLPPTSYYLKQRRGVTIDMSSSPRRKGLAGIKQGLSVLNKDLHLNFLVSRTRWLK